MANKSEGLEELLRAASVTLSPEKMMLSGLKGIIAAEIEIRRHEKGMSQQEFADFMGVSQALVSRWEKGECNYTLETLVKIASKLDIQIQCPFVASLPQTYSSCSNNVVYISSYYNGYNARVSSPSYGKYEGLSDLKEM